MRISGFTTVRPEMASTRTCEDFMKFLGANPSRLGLVANVYDGYTASALTEAVQNVYGLDYNATKGPFQRMNSFMVEWDLKIEKIKRVKIVSCAGSGANAGDVVFHFAENYYQKYDTFVVEDTRQQFMVMNRPQRLRDNDFLLVCKILDDNYDSTVIGGDLAGKTTRFVTNYMPELHEEGYTKYQNNLEKHRTYISTHRCDVDASAQYLAMEDTFIQIGKGKDGGKDDPWYKMNPMEKDLLDSFMYVRNEAALRGKSNMDASGKPKIYEPETGRPIVSSDGIIAQIERFANKFAFSKMNAKLFNKAIAALVSKCEKAQGNTFTLICNTAFYNEWQETMSAWIRDQKTTGTFLFSKAANGYVEVGATFAAYEFGANKLQVRLDRTLDVEFPNRKFAMLIDLTPDGTKGRAAINAFTYKGGEMIHNWIEGVGKMSGLASGAVSSPVAGSKQIMWGYNSVAVMNPYRSVILISNEEENAMF